MTTREQAERIQDPARREHFVYYAYDAADVLLYIGCTMQPETRWAAHRANKIWSQYAARFRMAGPYPYYVARDIESSEIAEHQPPFNADATTNRQARDRENRLMDQLLVAYQAEGMSIGDAAERALVEVDSVAFLHDYRPVAR